MRKIPDDVKARIIKRSQEGLSNRQIAEAFGLHKETINIIVRNAKKNGTIRT